MTKNEELIQYRNCFRACLAAIPMTLSDEHLDLMARKMYDRIRVYETNQDEVERLRSELAKYKELLG